MTKLVCVAKAGVGNRLRSILSCMWIAQNRQWDLEVYWSVYCAFRVTSEKMFKLPCPVVNFGYDNSHDLVRAAHPDKNIYVSHKHKIRERAEIIIYDFWTWALFPGMDLMKMKPKYGKMIQHVTWNPYIRQTVDGFCEQHSNIGDMVGVHVRRGDAASIKSDKQTFHRERQRTIPEKLYFDVLDGTNQPIFVCTENTDVIDSFHKRYGDRVCNFQCRSFKRREAVGCQDAAVDLLLLSKCRNILGGDSSFSEVAGVIGNAPRQILHNVDEEGV